MAGEVLVIFTLLTEAGQVPFVIVQVNVFNPKLKPVTVELGEVGLVTIAVEPAPTVQIPVPTVGAFADNVKVVLQVLWSVPAFAMVGAASRVMVTSLVEGVQVPLETVHLNTLIPIPKLVTWEVAEVAVTTEPPPCIIVHAPVPTVGGVAPKVAVVAQTVWFNPAFAVEGGVCTVMVTSEKEVVHAAPLEIVQRKV